MTESWPFFVIGLHFLSIFEADGEDEIEIITIPLSYTMYLPRSTYTSMHYLIH